MTVSRLTLAAAISLPCFAAEPVDNSCSDPFHLIATTKTKTTEREINEVARMGYRFIDMMAGETLGGDEVVTVMYLDPGTEHGTPRFDYKVLATNKTSTMQKELNEVGQLGYRYAGQSVAQTTFGGQSVVVIVERSVSDPDARYEYRLQATRRTKTMERELNEVGHQGFELMGLTVSDTMFGGQELGARLMRDAN